MWETQRLGYFSRISWIIDVEYMYIDILYVASIAHFYS